MDRLGNLKDKVGELENAINAFDGCLERLSMGEEEYTSEFLLDKFKGIQKLYAQADFDTRRKLKTACEEMAGEFYLALKDHFGYEKEKIPLEIREFEIPFHYSA